MKPDTKSRSRTTPMTIARVSSSPDMGYFLSGRCPVRHWQDVSVWHISIYAMAAAWLHDSVPVMWQFGKSGHNRERVTSRSSHGKAVVIAPAIVPRLSEIYCYINIIHHRAEY